MSLKTLQTYLHWNALLIVWADMPWQPIDALPVPRAVAIGRMRGEARAVGPLEWPFADLPAAPVLSLDPTNRLAQAFAAAGQTMHTVRTQTDVPADGRCNLLQLG